MDTSLECTGQKGKCVTLLGNQAKLEQSGSKSRRGCETRVQERKLGCSARGSSVWQPALSYGGGLASWKPGVTGDKQPPFSTVPAAKSSWTLITSNPLPWCVYFLILPNGKVVFLI